MRILQLLVCILFVAAQVHGATIPLPTNGGTVSWSSECFEHAAATVSMTSERAEVVLTLGKKTHLLCGETYVFATHFIFHIKRFDLSGEHHFHLPHWANDSYTDALENGIQTFFVPKGLVEDLVIVGEVFDKIFSSKSTVQDHLEFLEKYASFKFTPRANGLLNVSQSELRSGDYLSILKLSGQHGGSDTIIAYGTGGAAGHSAIIVEMYNQMFVLESINTGGITKTSWEQWIQTWSAQGALISLMRLSDEYAQKFDTNKAIAYFESVVGTPYGYENFLFGWIDTAANNFPPPLSEQLLASVMAIVDKVDRKVSTLMWSQALNHRLNTTNLDMAQIFSYIDANDISFAQVLTIPEEDAWYYSTGKSEVCSSFVMEVYKQAGIFGDMVFQGTEMTPRDVFSLGIWATEWQRPAACVAQDNRPFCQLTGSVWHEQVGWNSLAPLANMFEKCGALPPNYEYLTWPC